MRWSGQLVLAAGSMLDQPAEVVIDAAAAAGFDGVGLRLSAEHGTDRPSELRRRAADRGVRVFDVEVVRIGDGRDPEPLLDAAAAVDASAVLVVSDVADRAATVDRLHALVAESAARDLTVGFEYMAFTFPSAPADALSIAEEVGCAVVVDVLHHARLGAGPSELGAIAGAGRLGWLQLCDAPLAWPDGPVPSALADEARHHRLPPGRGELPLAELVAALPADATVSVEVQSDELSGVEPAERARMLGDAARSVLHG